MSSPPSKRPLKVFLCHALQDVETVRPLYDMLKRDGVDVWFVDEDLDPGVKWREKIPEVIKEADVALVCLSENSASKDGYFEEDITFVLNLAAKQPLETIFLIPVRLDQCNIPEPLAMYWWVDLYDEKSINPRNCGRLMRSLSKRAAQIGAEFSYDRTKWLIESNAILADEPAIPEDPYNLLHLSQDQRKALEILSMLRFFDLPMMQEILVSLEQSTYGKWDQIDFERTLKDWEERGIAIWKDASTVNNDIRSYFRRYLEKDVNMVYPIHTAAVTTYQTRLGMQVDDRKKLIVEELYHCASLVRLSNNDFDLPKILEQRLGQYAPSIRNSSKAWHLALEQLKEAIEHDIELKELIAEDVFQQLMEQIDLGKDWKLTKLTGEQLKVFSKALRSAFRTIDSLEQMARIELDQNIHDIGHGNLKNYVFRLIEWAESHGQLIELIKGALHANPDNPDLRDFAVEMGCS